MPEPRFFARQSEFRQWLSENIGKADSLLVGFYKVGSGKPSMTWPESVDEALCAGWIDGVRRRIDDESYSIRFTRRRTTSTWSAVNVKRMEELLAEGHVLPGGLRAYENRSERKTGIYSYEQRAEVELTESQVQQFKARENAWANFQSEAAWYRKTAIWWVISAKREETRAKRLEVLIESSANGKRIPSQERPETKK